MIDHHCHPFELEPGPLALHQLTLDLVDGVEGDERRRRIQPTFVWYDLLRARLADHLGCPVQEVEAARHAAAERDYRGYVRGLFAAAGVDTLLMDPAWPSKSADRVGQFEQLSGCRIHLLFRIDTVVDELLGEGVGFVEAVSRFDAALDDAVRRGYRGLKTILAYRTGLAVEAGVSAKAARASLHDDAPVRRRAKPLRDLLFRRALGFAADTRLPVQVHTGLGDSDLRLSDANPLHLEELLRTPEGSAAAVVLIHGAFPYHDEAAFLSVTRPNVYVDFSLFNLFAPTTVAERLLRLVDLAPTAKLLAGSDGFAAPESHWFAATVARDAWLQVRRRLADTGVTNAWLDRAQDAIFAANARELYAL